MEFHVVVNRYGRVLIFRAPPVGGETLERRVQFLAHARSIEAAIELCSAHPTRIVKQG